MKARKRQPAPELTPATSDGLSCPSCSCRSSSVRNTIKGATEIRRHRVCKGCGHSFATVEAAVDGDYGTAARIRAVRHRYEELAQEMRELEASLH
jgi:hypothetical protein